MSLISYQTQEIDDAVTQLQAAYRQTEDNHQRSLQVVAASEDSFGGQGSVGMQEAMATINHTYAGFRDIIMALFRVLGVANQGMTDADSQMSRQYV